MDMSTGMGFNALVNDALLRNLFGCTTSLHCVSSYVNTLMQDKSPFKKHHLSVPPRLNLMQTFAHRIVQKIDAEKEMNDTRPLDDLKNVAFSMIENIVKATQQWERRDALRMRVLTGKLQSASYVSKGLVIDAGNQAIPDGTTKVGMGKDEICGNVSNLIRIALNLSDPHRIGERSVNCLSDVTVEKNGSDLVKALINVLCFSYRNMREKVYIKCESPRLSIYTEMRKDMLAIEVNENGMGVKPEILRKICDKDLIIKYKNGTGSGLYQCNQAIQRIGGTMNVKSVYGKGFTTTIIAPYR